MTAKAVEDKTISRRDFLRTGMALAGVAAFGGFAATLPKCAVADTTTFPGIRCYPVMGVYKGASRGWTSSRTLLQDQYNFWVGASRENRYLDLGDGDAERYWFAGGQKFHWRDCLVDEDLSPTSHTQARNPSWSNYRWNQRDIFAEMLAGTSAVPQDKAKLGLFVAVIATAVKNPVPTWLLRDSRNLTWSDRQGKDHVRLDKDEGWRAVADLLVAMTQHYGLDQRIASLTIGEYYTNPDGGGIPAGFDYDAFRANAKKV
jgi:TAT (twin-arginine translocation) pathway signal sequence